MVSSNGKCSRSHGISSRWLRLQAEAIGIPIVQKKTSWETYEKKFKKAVLELKKEGIDTGIFGDVDLQPHRDWVERVCREVGIKPILPLWQGEREDLLKEFVDCGFEAIVVATKAEMLDETWVGRKIDGEFIKNLKSLGKIDLCGEAGEYHSFVYQGPIFKRPVEFCRGKKILKNKRWFLELTPG